jgi:iron(III) transport system permease protein
MSRTVLPGYVATSLGLCLVVAVGVALVGGITAAAVTLFDFPGCRTFEWALLLPLAMPAYVVAYAYTDYLQYSGPLQNWLRATFELQGRVFPEVRSTGGAAFVFIFSLYPYVYLLARTALSERAAHLMEAARLLGAPLRRRIRSIAFPLARPAIAAGVALALMETLADYGVSSYFGIQTFTTGIYKAWLAMDNRIAAAQLATLLLVVVAALLALERRAQRRMRFAASRGERAGSGEAQATPLRGGHRALAWLLCALPVLLGFVLPVLFMLRPLAADWSVLPWDRFVEWGYNSVRLGAISAVLAVVIATLMAFSLRRSPDAVTRGVVQLAALGYAVPGAVIVVGLLLPVGWLQAAAPTSGVGGWVTATVLGVVWAYLVRFVSVALQSVQSGYSRIPGSFDDSARMLGVAGFALLRRIHWPLLRRSTTAAALLVFVDVMKELPATLVLRPFDTDTLAVVAYQLARDERLGEAALPSLALVLVGLIPVVLLSRALRSTPR